MLNRNVFANVSLVLDKLLLQCKVVLHGVHACVIGDVVGLLWLKAAAEFCQRAANFWLTSTQNLLVFAQAFKELAVTFLPE